MKPAIVLPPRPEAPEPGDCCGSGCVRCVLDLYDERLRDWELRCAALAVAGTGPAIGLRTVGEPDTE